MEEDTSNPTSLYNFTVPSSNKSSKVIFISKNNSSPESNSASSSQKKSKMAKLSFNEMIFLSQTGIFFYEIDYILHRKYLFDQGILTVKSPYNGAQKNT